jgi:hypothetical protein
MPNLSSQPGGNATFLDRAMKWLLVSERDSR